MIKNKAPQSTKTLWLMVIFTLFLGVSIGILYGLYNPEKVYIEKCSTKVTIDGIWLNENSFNKLSNYDGTFICINTKEIKDLVELRSVCEHEIGHEIFARICENDFDKCLEVTK